VNPEFPIYIVSKGRADSRLTSKALESTNVPYRIVIEEQEFDDYASVIDKDKILILDPEYQEKYDTFDTFGNTKSKGPGAARNFVWDHSTAEGHAWHWVMDDNIRGFFRFNRNLKVPVSDGTILKCMEDFVLRYKNISMAGPNYFMFAARKSKAYPFTLNTRIYSCNLIRNDTGFRWRGRYNEDTDLSLRMLKRKWVTVLFNAFLQYKMPTQQVSGGNTKEFYDKEGTLAKSRMQVAMHPDVSKLVWKFNRWHHSVNYKLFGENRLLLKDGIEIPLGGNNYGMDLKLKTNIESNLSESRN